MCLSVRTGTYSSSCSLHVELEHAVPSTCITIMAFLESHVFLEDAGSQWGCVQPSRALYKTRKHARCQFLSQLWSQFWSQRWSQIRSQIWSQIRSQFWSRFWSQFWSRFWSQLWCPSRHNNIMPSCLFCAADCLRGLGLCMKAQISCLYLKHQNMPHCFGMFWDFPYRHEIWALHAKPPASSVAKVIVNNAGMA